MQLSKSLLFASSVLSAGLAAAQDWGRFDGQVDTIEYLIGNDYSLTSDLTIALNSSWSLVDIIGRREGQIANKSIIFNTADNKYYAKIAYTNTATSQTDNSLCFPAVPIRISLNQEKDGEVQLRLIDGSFDIGCLEKTRVEGAVTSTKSPSTIGASSFSTTKSVETSTSIITESKFSTVSTTSEEPSTSTLSETPMSTVLFASSPTASVFEVQTSSFVTFTTTSSVASASTVTPNISASATSTIGNGSINGVDQSNSATRMASIESTFYMGAFVALFLAATLA
ncbi:hypothetical protein D0Z00_002443 [Geotrichum galactomycetum]|uniref:Uncharacterized protein n=1 Tax=Geotrichum galactomycetum TaxID=27317 RepID=A0ACB6V463_9ASCO|nr:hypothetical protein D0Z00_002443 [Geotrichum candidum]